MSDKSITNNKNIENTQNTKTKLVERSCVICRKKNPKQNFLRFVKLSDTNYKFDRTAKAQSRGYYCCYDLNCLGKLAKHNKFKLDSSSLISMLNIINSKNKNIINILKAMKNSNELSFGINMVMDDIKKINYLVIASDINKKNKAKIVEKAREYNIAYLNISTKAELGEIFSKDEVNVIGIKDKKMARGLLSNQGGLNEDKST